MSLPTVVTIVNQAKTPLGTSLTSIVQALQTYMDKYGGPAWGVNALYVISATIPKTGQYLVLLDDADQAGALGYHDDVVGAAGYPYARVFVKTSLDNGEAPSKVVGHEALEMAVDPLCNRLVMDNRNGWVWPLETTDAVEEDEFTINGLPFPNFCLPAWFDWTTPVGTRVDLMGKITGGPFTLGENGYGNVIKDGQWEDLFGSDDKMARFAKEDRRGHRSELRIARFSKAGFGR